MIGYRLSGPAKADIVKILAWSERQLGELARVRYAALITAALRGICGQPDRPGSILRPELGEGVRSWHLSLNRERARTATGIARRPRHFLIYRMDGELVVVGRVLHDAMESAHQLDDRPDACHADPD
ncbi:MAG: type II toxin-antitoxin system RelE/ParE family toxin [Steroidobacteraceae bacterium]